MTDYDIKLNRTRIHCLGFLRRLRDTLKEFSEEFNEQEYIDPFPIDAFNPVRLRLTRNKYLDHIELYIIIDLYKINNTFRRRSSEKKRTYIIKDEFIPVFRLRIVGDVFSSDVPILLTPYFSQVINSVSTENYHLRQISGNKFVGFIKDIDLPISVDLINSLKNLIYEFHNSPKKVFEEYG